MGACDQACIACRLQGDTLLEQALPTEPALQPLSNHGIALNVSGELSRSETMPRTSAPCAFAVRWQIADLNVSIVDAVLFTGRTIPSFKPKAHRSECHGRSPFPGQRYI